MLPVRFSQEWLLLVLLPRVYPLALPQENLSPPLHL